MFLHEIDSLWQQQAGYYTREEQNKGKIIVGALLYVKIELRNKQYKDEGSEELKRVMLNLYLTRSVVIQRGLQH